MTLAHCTVSADMFRALVSGGSSDDVVDRLTSARLSKILLLLRRLIRTGSAGRDDTAARVCGAYDCLALVRREAPDAFRAVIGYPTVGSWILNHARPGTRLDRLAEIAAAAAVRGRVAAELVLSPADGSITLPSLGTATLAGTGPVLFRFDGRSTELRRGAATAVVTDWQGLPRIVAEHHGMRWSVRIDRPPRLAVPDAADLTTQSLTDADLAVWTDRLTEGWRLLVDHHPVAAREIAATVRMITPMPGGPTRRASASLSDYYGCVLMTLPADERVAAVTLIHECQHSKLTGLLDLLPLVATDTEDRFYAPWRGDPRPAIGLLHGIYAHLGITGFWQRQRHVTLDPHAETEYFRWRSATLETSTTLLD
ncbi:MAG TPA: HEXXH motif-containing putative peptide modification protein, partial [Pseudonocardiaceae bacterium]